MSSLLRFVSLALMAAALIGSPGDSLAQSYPHKPIHLIVPYAPGGGMDILARLIGQKLHESLKQPVIIDNRPGAGGTIGTGIAAKAAPDGYTIVMVISAHATNPSLYKKLPYDAVKDFAPITQVVSFPFLLVVNPSLPAKSVTELIALAKSKPGRLNFSSSGTGGGTHLSGELFKTMAGVDMVHVAYKGSAPALTALLGGEVPMMFSDPLVTLPQVKAGKIRALAWTSAKRSPQLSEVPTVAESGVPGYEVNGWQGILAPAGTPREIIDKLNAEILKVLQMADVKERLSSQAMEPVGSSPEQFAALIQAEIVKWGKVIKDCGARID